MRISDWSSDVCSSDLTGLASANSARVRSQPRLPAPPRASVASASGNHLSAMSACTSSVSSALQTPGRESLPSTARRVAAARTEEHTSELQSLMRSSYAVFCLNKKKEYKTNQQHVK